MKEKLYNVQEDKNSAHPAHAAHSLKDITVVMKQLGGDIKPEAHKHMFSFA